MFHVWGTDRFGHELWHILDESHPMHDPAEAHIYRDRVVGYWRKVDEVVGDWMEAAGEDVTTMVVSDHGFGPIHKFLVFNVWLLQQRWIQLKPGLGTFVRRSLFELGVGTVAVADPDEWDDADHTDSAASGWYKTFLTTPEIDVSGVQAGALELKFDSSWRPEYDSNYRQTANVTASFDGAEPVQVLLWESDEASANYKPYATNETVILNLDNPEGASSMVLTFGLFDAGNDWWWAIDNVAVSGPAK